MHIMLYFNKLFIFLLANAKIPYSMKKIFEITKEKIFFRLFFIILFSSYASHYAQISPDHKKNRSFKELEKSLGTLSKNRTAAFTITKEYIKLAKEKENIDELFNGYSYATTFAPDDNKTKYSDSLVDIAVSTKDQRYIGLAYASSANVNFKLYNYRRALDLAIIADDYLKNEKSKEYSYLGKFTIGRLKNKIGDNNEAFKIITEIYQYYLWKKDNKQTTDIRASYIYSLINLVRINASLQNFKENKALIQEGYNYIKIHNDVAFYLAELTSADAFNDYSSNRYKQSIDKFKKSISLYDDADSHFYEKFYLGMSYWKLGNPEVAKIFFDQISEDYHNTGRISQEFRPVFEFAIENNKKNGSRDDHLSAVDDLIDYDRKFKDEQKDIAKKMNIDYDKKKLLDEKEQLEKDRLKEKMTFVAIIILAIIGISGLLIYMNKKIGNNNSIKLSTNDPSTHYDPKYHEQATHSNLQKIDAHDFTHENSITKYNEEIVENTDGENIKNSDLSKIEKDQKTDEINYNLYQPINKFTVKQILKNLEEFERREKFLISDLKLTILAERFHTNDKYLSRVIKVKTGNNFNTYINELRFKHLEKMIEENPTIKGFKIKEISRKLGFGSPEFFSTAFKEKYNITPTEYFERIKSI